MLGEKMPPPFRTKSVEDRISQKGMTLVELVMVIALTGMLAGFVANILYYEINAYEIVTSRGQAGKNGRFALQLMSREIRQVVSADSIFQASADSLRFADINGLTINYKHTSPKLFRNGDPLADNVTAFQMTYLNDNGTQLSHPIADLTTIRTISLELTTTFGSQSVQTQISVTPRNF